MTVCRWPRPAAQRLPTFIKIKEWSAPQAVWLGKQKGEASDLPSCKLTWPWKIHHFDGIYQEKWGFSWAMLVYQRVPFLIMEVNNWCSNIPPFSTSMIVGERVNMDGKWVKWKNILLHCQEVAWTCANQNNVWLRFHKNQKVLHWNRPYVIRP